MGAKNRSRVFFIIVNAAVYLILIGFFTFAHKQTEYDLLSNQLYFDNILRVDNGQEIDWETFSCEGQYRIYIEINENCRALIKDTSKWTPPMLSGCFPQEHDGERRAVIGKNIIGTSYMTDDKGEWVSCAGQKFRVAGVVGAEYATSCDDLVLLFGMKFEKEQLADHVVIVDVKTAEMAEKISQDLIKQYPDVQIQSGSVKGTARLTKSSYFYRLLYAEVVFIVFVSLFIFGKYRHEQYKNNYRVYYICGLPMSKVLITEILEILIVNIISLTAACGGSYLWGLYYVDINVHFSSLLKTAILITAGSEAMAVIFFLNGCTWHMKRHPKERPMKC